MVALVGVLVSGVLAGLLLAGLGKLPGHDAYEDIREYPQAAQIPGLLIVRPDVPLFFANANTTHNQIRKLLPSASSPTKVLILDLVVSDDLDISVTDMLNNLVEELVDDGIQLLLAEVLGPTRSRLKHTGLLERIGEENFYLGCKKQ